MSANYAKTSIMSLDIDLYFKNRILPKLAGFFDTGFVLFLVFGSKHKTLITEQAYTKIKTRKLYSKTL